MYFIYLFIFWKEEVIHFILFFAWDWKIPINQSEVQILFEQLFWECAVYWEKESSLSAHLLTRSLTCWEASCSTWNLSIIKHKWERDCDTQMCQCQMDACIKDTVTIWTQYGPQNVPIYQIIIPIQYFISVIQCWWKQNCFQFVQVVFRSSVELGLCWLLRWWRTQFSAGEKICDP